MTGRPFPGSRGRLGRLTRRPQFLAAAAARRKAGTPGLVLQARPHDSGQRPEAGEPAVRVGLTASRKVGNAVVRNRARRRLRAAASSVLPEHAAPGFDLVLIARTETADRPFDALRDDLLLALRRVGAAASSGDAEPAA